MHPTLGRPYTQVVYRPMRELIDFLGANDFRVYICTGGGRDFVRAVCEQIYGVPRDRVIGSATTVEYRDGDLYRTGGVEQPIDDGPGKPVHIWARTGRKPLLAGGNADGDVAMIESARFALLLHHDDAEREFAYDDGAERALAEAEARGWTVVSMKGDFKTVFLTRFTRDEDRDHTTDRHARNPRGPRTGSHRQEERHMPAVQTHVEPARLAASPEDYARFGLTKGHLEPWEDGLRLDPGAPNIEWWYFDALLDDGAKLSVIHCTKDASRPHQPLEPLIEIDLDLPDGRRMSKYGRFKAQEFSAAREGCDVRIGEYVFTGDLHDYHITGKAQDLSAEVRLESVTEPWRPETGHLVFGPDGETIFAWAPVRAHGQGDGDLPHRGGGARDDGHGLPRPQLDEPGDGTPDRPLVLGARPGRALLVRDGVHHDRREVRLRRVPLLHARARRQGGGRRRRQGHLLEERQRDRPPHRQAGPRRDELRLPRRRERGTS